MAKENDEIFEIPEWRELSDKDFEKYLKDALEANDCLVIPKVVSDVVAQIGVEKTAKLSRLSVINVSKSICLAKAQKELEPYPDPYKIPPPFKMDIRGLFEYAQKRGVEIKDLQYVEVLDFIG